MNTPEQSPLERALQHHSAGRLAEAEALYQQILQADPGQHDALHLLGVLAHQVGKNAIAVDLISKAIAIKPDFAEAHYNLGNAHTGLAQHEAAANSYRQATALKPEYAAAHLGLGTALRDLKDLQNAAASYRQAIAIKPDLAQAHCNLGLTLQDLGDLEAATACYHQALDIQPDFAQALFNLGNALKEQGQPEQAVTRFTQALNIKPDDVDALYNLGNTLQELGNIKDAITTYEKLPAIKPDHVNGRYNLGLAQLLTGNFESGFENYKLRWQTAQLRQYRRVYDQPLWTGEELMGKTLFLYPEQGLGDFIQFSRYVGAAAEKVARVIVEVPKALRCLYSSLPGADVIIETGQSPEDFDVHLPLLDLPGIFTRNPQSIPPPGNYPTAAHDLCEQWKDRLGAHQGLRVGLVWAGRAGHVNDSNRSIDLNLLRPLLDIKGATLFSLQVGRPGEVAKIFGPQVIDLSQDLSTFAQTAAVMANLDLVISVDSAPAHLAGALGRPVWTLLPYLPDWRWMLEREDSPWYPSMRLLRQRSPGDWQTLIAQVGDQLSEIT